MGRKFSWAQRIHTNEALTYCWYRTARTRGDDLIKGNVSAVKDLNLVGAGSIRPFVSMTNALNFLNPHGSRYNYEIQEKIQVY